ncbi:melanoma inhibitory activity protein 2 isoform X2 [Hemicordylus capensis]|uniref:melanoma inhibitory activity protein 2 isoform X2 n=1 Tax=Hemicordylus capensis TaxID=884348 RepID=UPI0023046A76|nr:melanoma inhibitory activity protein 2 isoform X2 [Hemicordylus capensis]
MLEILDVKTLLLILSLLTNTKSTKLLSEQKKCGDPECETSMSRVQAIKDHVGPDCRYLNFTTGEEIMVYFKLSRKREDLWAGSKGQDFGYFPVDAVQIEEVFIKEEVEVEVPTKETDFVCLDGGEYIFENEDSILNHNNDENVYIPLYTDEKDSELHMTEYEAPKHIGIASPKEFKKPFPDSDEFDSKSKDLHILENTNHDDSELGCSKTEQDETIQQEDQRSKILKSDSTLSTWTVSDFTGWFSWRSKQNKEATGEIPGAMKQIPFRHRKIAITDDNDFKNLNDESEREPSGSSRFLSSLTNLLHYGSKKSGLDLLYKENEPEIHDSSTIAGNADHHASTTTPETKEEDIDSEVSKSNWYDLQLSDILMLGYSKQNKVRREKHADEETADQNEEARPLSSESIDTLIDEGLRKPTVVSIHLEEQNNERYVQEASKEAVESILHEEHKENYVIEDPDSEVKKIDSEVQVANEHTDSKDAAVTSFSTEPADKLLKCHYTEQDSVSDNQVMEHISTKAITKESERKNDQSEAKHNEESREKTQNGELVKGHPPNILSKLEHKINYDQHIQITKYEKYQDQSSESLEMQDYSSTEDKNIPEAKQPSSLKLANLVDSPEQQLYATGGIYSCEKSCPMKEEPYDGKTVGPDHIEETEKSHFASGAYVERASKGRMTERVENEESKLETYKKMIFKELKEHLDDVLQLKDIPDEVEKLLELSDEDELVNRGIIEQTLSDKFQITESTETASQAECNENCSNEDMNKNIFYNKKAEETIIYQNNQNSDQLLSISSLSQNINLIKDFNSEEKSSKYEESQPILSFTQYKHLLSFQSSAAKNKNSLQIIQENMSSKDENSYPKRSAELILRNKEAEEKEQWHQIKGKEAAERDISNKYMLLLSLTQNNEDNENVMKNAQLLEGISLASSADHQPEHITDSLFSNENLKGKNTEDGKREFLTTQSNKPSLIGKEQHKVPELKCCVQKSSQKYKTINKVSYAYKQYMNGKKEIWKCFVPEVLNGKNLRPVEGTDVNQNVLVSNSLSSLQLHSGKYIKDYIQEVNVVDSYKEKEPADMKNKENVFPDPIKNDFPTNPSDVQNTSVITNEEGEWLFQIILHLNDFCYLLTSVFSTMMTWSKKAVAVLSENMRPDPDLYGFPWELVICGAIVAMFTIFLLMCRSYQSIKSRRYIGREKQLASKVAELVEDKCKVLETLSLCKKEYEALENSLKDASLVEGLTITSNIKTAYEELNSSNCALKNEIECLEKELEEEKAKRSEQDDLMAEIQRRMESLENEAKSIQMQVAEAKTTLKVYEINRERLKTSVQNAMEENSHLHESEKQLLQEAEGWGERFSELNEQTKMFETSKADMEEALKNKDSQIKSLTECLLKMKDWSCVIGEHDAAEGNHLAETENGAHLDDQEKLTVKKLIRAAKLNACLKSLETERNQIYSKLTDENKAKEELEERIENLQREHVMLQSGNTHFESEVQKLQQKLKVMTELYQENEINLHRKLTVEEKERLQKEEKLSKVDEKISYAAEELNTYRQRAKDLEEELERTVRSYQSQIMSHEKKAHDNWLTARAAERHLNDIRKENSHNRQKLTEAEFKYDLLEKDPYALDIPVRAFGREHSPYGPSPMGRPSSETRAFLSPPTLLEGPLRLSPVLLGGGGRGSRGPGNAGMYETGNERGELNSGRLSDPHRPPSDTGSLSPPWDRDRRIIPPPAGQQYNEQSLPFRRPERYYSNPPNSGRLSGPAELRSYNVHSFDKADGQSPENSSRIDLSGNGIKDERNVLNVSDQSLAPESETFIPGVMPPPLPLLRAPLLPVDPRGPFMRRASPFPSVPPSAVYGSREYFPRDFAGLPHPPLSMRGPFPMRPFSQYPPPRAGFFPPPPSDNRNELPAELTHQSTVPSTDHQESQQET